MRTFQPGQQREQRPKRVFKEHKEASETDAVHSHEGVVPGEESGERGGARS